MKLRMLFLMVSLCSVPLMARLSSVKVKVINTTPDSVTVVWDTAFGCAEIHQGYTAACGEELIDGVGGKSTSKDYTFRALTTNNRIIIVDKNGKHYQIPDPDPGTYIWDGSLTNWSPCGSGSCTA